MNPDVKAVREWQAEWDRTTEKGDAVFAHPYKKELARILDNYEAIENALKRISNIDPNSLQGEWCRDKARETLRKVRGE
jgi:hypothetical protein